MFSMEEEGDELPAWPAYAAARSVYRSSRQTS